MYNSVSSLLLAVSLPVYAEQSHILELGFANDTINEAAHLYANFEEFDRHWSRRLGVSLVLTDDVYGALDAGLRMQMPLAGPFIGIGAYYGQNRFCDTLDETCDADVVLGAYPELGINLWVTKDIRLSVFGRYYYTTSQIDNDYKMIGIGIGFK